MTLPINGISPHIGTPLDKVGIPGIPLGIRLFRIRPRSAKIMTAREMAYMYRGIDIVINTVREMYGMVDRIVKMTMESRHGIWPRVGECGERIG